MYNVRALCMFGIHSILLPSDHPDDPLAMPLALVTLAPPFLIVAYVSILLVRRELTILLGFVGQLGCEIVNLVLKRTLRQGRPTDFLGTGYGMPSSHSQFAGYFIAFWTWHFLRFRPGMMRRSKQGTSTSRSLVDILRTLEHFSLLLLIVLGCVVVPYSRYASATSFAQGGFTNFLLIGTTSRITLPSRFSSDLVRVFSVVLLGTM